ncbi:MAG: replication initiation protein [Candidatus Omnitrophota bacterium]|jgi:plasmid replication initiation protein
MPQKPQTRDETRVVVKSNYLIEASYRLSLQEQRLILLMVSKIKQDDQNFHAYQIAVKDFNRIVGIKGEGSYQRTKELTKKLLERSMQIIKDKSVLQITWLSSAEYFEGKGYVELSFDPKLKPYLLQLKDFFTRYRLQHVIRLKSSYSIKLYELLKQYENIGKRSFTLLELRSKLGLGEDEYPLYANFKQKILSRVQEELNANTDLSIHFHERKAGRKVIGIVFNIVSKGKEPDETPATLTDRNELKERLHDYFCLSESQAEDIIERYDEDHIMANLAYVEEKQKQGAVKNIGPYTLKAIEEDYRIQKSRFETNKDQERQNSVALEAQKRLLESREREYGIFRRNMIETFRKGLPEAKFQRVKDEVRDEVIGRYGEGNPMFPKLLEIAIKNRLAKLAAIPSLEVWSKADADVGAPTQ